MNTNTTKISIIRKALFDLSSVFPDRKLSLFGINIYCEFLEKYDSDIIGQATNACIQTCFFFPSIAEIIEKAQPFIKTKSLDILTLPDNYDDVMRTQDKKRHAIKQTSKEASNEK